MYYISNLRLQKPLHLCRCVFPMHLEAQDICSLREQYNHGQYCQLVNEWSLQLWPTPEINSLCLGKVPFSPSMRGIEYPRGRGLYCLA